MIFQKMFINIQLSKSFRRVLQGRLFSMRIKEMLVIHGIFVDNTNTLSITCAPLARLLVS